MTPSIHHRMCFIQPDSAISRLMSIIDKPPNYACVLSAVGSFQTEVHPHYVTVHEWEWDYSGETFVTEQKERRRDTEMPCEENITTDATAQVLERT